MIKGPAAGSSGDDGPISGRLGFVFFFAGSKSNAATKVVASNDLKYRENRSKDRIMKRDLCKGRSTILLRC